MALQLTSLNFSGLMWENLSSDLLIMDINKKNVCYTATGSDHLYPKRWCSIPFLGSLAFCKASHKIVLFASGFPFGHQ
jgi:hypothetical protein